MYFVLKEMRIEQPKKRRPIFGHLIVISQIIVTVLHQETISEPPPVPPRPAVVSETESELRGASESDSTRGSASDSLSAAVADRPASADAQETSHFRDILAETGLATAWEEVCIIFVDLLWSRSSNCVFSSSTATSQKS